MNELAGMPIVSAVLFFFAGLIFASLFSGVRSSKKLQESLESQRYQRAKFAWRQRKTQVDQLRRYQALVDELKVSLEKKSGELSNAIKNYDTIRSSLSQLEGDYLEQKEHLHRQVRRNRMLNAQLTEVIEAKAKLSALQSTNHPHDDHVKTPVVPINHRFSSEVATRPLIISDRVKLRIPRTAENPKS